MKFNERHGNQRISTTGPWGKALNNEMISYSMDCEAAGYGDVC